MRSASTWQRRWRQLRQRSLLEFASILPGLSGLSPRWSVFLLRFIQRVTHTRDQCSSENAKNLLMSTLWKMICLSNLQYVTEPREAGVSFTPCNSSFKLLEMFRFQTKLQCLSWSYHDPLLRHARIGKDRKEKGGMSKKGVHLKPGPGRPLSYPHCLDEELAERVLHQRSSVPSSIVMLKAKANVVIGSRYPLVKASGEWAESLCRGTAWHSVPKHPFRKSSQLIWRPNWSNS